MLTNTTIDDNETLPAAPSLCVQIQEHLDRELECAKALAVLLEQENGELSSQNKDITGQINQITEQKQPLLDALEQNAVQREKWLATKVGDNAKPNVKNPKTYQKAWAELLQNFDGFADQWAQAEQYIVLCQRLNAINSRLIGFRHKRGQKLSEILFGKTQVETYTAQGRATGHRGSGSVITA